MRSQHQRTDLGTLLERDWVTTNGLNPLRFGSGRKIWYNSGNFVFTTSNVPSYHKKHKLSTETKQWTWNECETADSTVNTIMPTFNTTDLRDYAYYGSCVELIRSTVEEIIADFPGRITTTTVVPTVSNIDFREWNKTLEELKKQTPFESETSYDGLSGVNYYYSNNKWNIAPKVENDREVINKADETMVGNVFYVEKDHTIKTLKVKRVKNTPYYYLEHYGSATGKFSLYYVYDEMNYYNYNYEKCEFEELPQREGLVYGYRLENPFQIDLHHKKVTLDTYDNPMRYMSNSWKKYCIKVRRSGTIKEYRITEDFSTDTKEYKKDDIITIEEYNNLGEYQTKCEPVYECCCGSETYNTEYCLFEGNVIGFKIEEKEEYACKSDNEGRILKVITFKTDNRNMEHVTIYGYYINGTITYVYKPTEKNEVITIQPQQTYIDEYFNGLTGFKKQLLRQDTKPLYMNTFITPTEYDFVWYYPLKTYILPSTDYCIDVDTNAFTSFIGKLYDVAQNFDNLWSDNLYRSMTHESIKNFDWSYSRDYYEGDEQDNIDGGERMQKIIRVLGRVFDDIKLYIDTVKLTPNITYDQYKNCPEALLSDHNETSGFDVKSTISTIYDLDTNIDNDYLTTVNKGASWTSIDEGTKITSSLSKWYPSRNSTDIYPDIMDNEFMRRMLLSSKRIMQSKGTQESIEMVFALFGFGKDIDYTITEEAYYTQKMIPSEECLDGTVDGKKKGEDWTQTVAVDWKVVDSTKKGDLATEINQLRGHNEMFYTDPLYLIPLREVYLGRKNNIYLVPYYDSTQMYDDDLIFQGKGGWGKMIKNNDDDPLDDKLDYQETLSYLHVAGNIKDLLDVNPNTVNDNDIYYVSSLDDYTDYDECPPMDIEKNVTMSHYFILINSVGPDKLYYWKNIIVQPQLDSDGNLQMVSKTEFEGIFDSIKYMITEDFDGYKAGEIITEEDYSKLSEDKKKLCEKVDLREWKYEPDGDETDTEKLGTYKYAFKKMRYLDNIFSTNVGNNPHVGYGLYDDGSKFIEYMKLPFKHLIEHPSEIPSQYSSILELAKKFKFDDINCIIGYKVIESFMDKMSPASSLTRKYNIGELVSEELYAVFSDENKSKCEKVESCINDKIQIMNSRYINSDYIKYTSDDGNTLTKEYQLTDDEYNVEKRWFINSKVLTIQSLINDTNGLFNQYFKSIIMPYIMQVIPSTTILKLKGFS